MSTILDLHVMFNSSVLLSDARGKIISSIRTLLFVV